MFKNILKIMLISLFCLSLVGCENSPYAKTDDYTTTAKGNIPVIVNAENRAEKMNVENMIKHVEDAPDYLTENVGTIYILNNGSDMFDDTVLGNDQIVAGYVPGDCDEQGKYNIYMKAPIATKSYSTPWEFDDGDIVHEMWHTFDNSHDVSDTTDFLNLYNSNPECLGGHAASESCEFFAEAGRYYTLYPDQLNEIYPSLYNYFEALPKE